MCRRGDGLCARLGGPLLRAGAEEDSDHASFGAWWGRFLGPHFVRVVWSWPRSHGRPSGTRRGCGAVFTDAAQNRPDSARTRRKSRRNNNPQNDEKARENRHNLVRSRRKAGANSAFTSLIRRGHGTHRAQIAALIRRSQRNRRLSKSLGPLGCHSQRLQSPEHQPAPPAQLVRCNSHANRSA
jgi:hypothetical protein